VLPSVVASTTGSLQAPSASTSAEAGRNRRLG
jgi:hypothetical protein